MPFAAGETFHLGDTNSTRHLHIVLFASNSPAEPVIVVSVNTVTNWTDRTLILKIGDHPYIKHDSAVSFNRIRSLPLKILQFYETNSQNTALSFRRFDWDQPVSSSLLEQIIQGALTSSLTPKGMKEALRIRLAQRNQTNESSSGDVA